MLHSGGGLPQAVLLFTLAFQNQKLAKSGLADYIINLFYSFMLHIVIKTAWIQSESDWKSTW